MDYLLGVDDRSRIGALRLLDQSGNFLRTIEDGSHGTPPLLELAQLISATRAVELNKETEADLHYLRGRGTSLGGMRPKCTILDDDGHLAIGKFPSIKDDRSVTRGEVLALHLPSCRYQRSHPLPRATSTNARALCAICASAPGNAVCSSLTIAATLRTPSQRFNISPALTLSLMRPSGYSMT